MQFGYVRISSVQEKELREEQRVSLLEEGIVEQNIHHEIAAPKGNNPVLMQALQALKRGDTLVIWRLDRLGVSVSGLIKLVRTMDCDGIGLKSLEENIDTTTTQALTIGNFFAILSNYEHLLRSERIKIGHEKAKLRGKVRGRPQTISAEKCASIMEMIAAGVPKAEICRKSKVPRSTLYDMLRRQK